MPFARSAKVLLGKARRRLRPGKPRAQAPQADRSRRSSTHQALPGDRLLVRPVFVLSSIRSGSTLLRVMLNSHSAIHAPHELHLSTINVTVGGRYTDAALDEIGLDAVQLRYLLWDRLLHRELTRYGKQVLVNKTPSDAFQWRRIVQCWPDARLIFLLRHPAAVTDSWAKARPNWSRERVAEDVLRYMVAVEDARTRHGGLTVKYEEITVEPEREMRRVCDYLELGYEPSIVEYGQAEHGEFQAGLGDWSSRIRSGKVQPIERLPTREETPASLIDISTRWGYLSDEG